MYILILLSIILILTYYVLSKNNDYWKKRNVPHPKPVIFFGNIIDTIMVKKSLAFKCIEIYNEFPAIPYVGFYKARKPGLVIKDAALIETITVKDFQHFENNDIYVDDTVDPIAGKNPFFLRGQKWNHTRRQLTVCFTSGKLKMMFPLIKKVSDDMVKYIKDCEKLGQTTHETKELCAKFTTDVVASCAFGLEAESFVDENAEFRKMGKVILYPTLSMAIRLLLITVFPSLGKILKTKFVPEEAANYLRGIITSTLKYREENQIVRNDFLDTVSQIRKTDSSYTIDDVTAHAFSFFADGYETSSIALSFTLFELAVNLDVQEKLRGEIEEKLSKYDGEITYEGLQELHYLDWIIYETLRLHPPAMALFKLCTKEYEFPFPGGPGGKLKVEVDTPIALPIFALHRDPKYFPDPEKFDPGRFSDARRPSIPKGAYFAFGMGPRICIGQRFALLQLKVGVVAAVKNYDVRLNRKTELPLEFDEKYFLLISKRGVWLDYYKRGDPSINKDLVYY